jgi:4-hydroxy-3-polyprenylbenzoate decarboxylase
MPLPEGVPELAFAGVLGGRSVRLVRAPESPLPIPTEADFCIVGTVEPNRLSPEGPFGDHLGYYALTHDFPVLKVDAVYHRPNAVWPFTSVGRPPQEDSNFGAFIHELTASMIPRVLPGVHAVNAVDAAGVHPLLLALGSERYAPYLGERRPMELLTQANAILGQGQLSLAKYLWIAAREDEPKLDVRNVPALLRHLLERADWRRDLHFQTCTTMDTLDYSGGALNEGSKVVVAAVGNPIRRLTDEWPASVELPSDFGAPRRCMPGVFAISGPTARAEPNAAARLSSALLPHLEELSSTAFIVLADDADFVARSLDDFLWVTFTRSDPAADVHGVGEFVERKHWGCRGPLVIDARLNPHHPPPLEDDPEVAERVDRLAAPGGPLHGLI